MIGRRPGKVGVVGNGWRQGFPKCGDARQGIDNAGRGILTKAPGKAERQPLREGMGYLMMNLFNAPTSILRKPAWERD
jgi:hypothetical protein